MKKYKYLLLLILLIIVSIICFIKITNNNIKNTIYVITMDDKNKINYYELTNGNIKKTSKFSSNINMIIVDNCFESYIDKEKNKVVNKFTKDTCELKTVDNEIIESNNEIDNILKNIQKINHDILKTKILYKDDKYYAVVELNVNWQDPYDLYYYDLNNKVLNKIYSFDSEDVIGLKID